jgi:hypothetical protein
MKTNVFLVVLKAEMSEIKVTADLLSAEAPFLMMEQSW